MKRIFLTQKTTCFLLIFLCFLWTSSGYLSWLYHLMEFVSGTSVDILTEVIGYLFQALGLLFFALIVRRCPKAAGRTPCSIVIAADFLMIVLSVLSRSLAAALIFGYCMNTLHGIVAGFYLYRLMAAVPLGRRELPALPLCTACVRYPRRIDCAPYPPAKGSAPPGHSL